MPTLYSVTLSESERRIARWLARSRYESNRSQGVVNHRVGPQSDEETDLLGMEGELAFAKIVNAYPDLEVKPQAKTFDLTVNGWTVDVKTTNRENGRLLVTLGSEEKAEVYVLMVGENGTYRWAGWCHGWAICCEDQIIDLGHGKTYGLTQDMLLEPERTDWLKETA